MPYTHRLATIEDALAIAPLWKAFAEERESIDPSMLIKPNFDFQKYITHQLTKPLCFCWVLEHRSEEQLSFANTLSPISFPTYGEGSGEGFYPNYNSGMPFSHETTNQKTIVGCLFIYFYDEAPPPNLPLDLIQQHDLENPFQPRRVGSVLGMYVQPSHRHPDAIKLLADAGIHKAEEMKVTDIDLLIAADQTGIQALLQRAGFTKAAVQYTRHYHIPTSPELPTLHPPHPELPDVESPAPSAIPLRDPSTNELVRNPFGEPVFLIPLVDKRDGYPQEMLQTSGGLPIYPTPVRDPHKNDWVFDANGELVVCPVLRDENGQIVEHHGIPQFHPPAYEPVNGEIRLKRDVFGKYVFCESERDKQGKIVRSPDGMPLFKQPVFA